MKKHVLLVEYDTPTIELIQEILSSPIFRIEIVDEGEAAKELIKKKKFDLVVTAAMLPKFHGFNLSQYIGTVSPHTKIIIISGVYKGIEYKHQAINQYMADDFIEKPLNKKNLKKKILELLNLSEEDLKPDKKSPATEIPLTDTAKIPAPHISPEENKKYSSTDLFGDIIEEVEKTFPEEIAIEIENSEEKKVQAAEPKPGIPPIVPQRNIPSKIELELARLVQEKKEIPDTKRFKKIEDDISKKLEDTLSGLGIKPKTPAEKQIPDKKKKAEPEPKAVESAKTPKKETSSPKTVKSKTDELGDYDILGLIARGGMAEIYKAKRKGVKGFEKIIAIKKILSGYGEDDKYIEMFVDEAKIAAELSHPNIVQIYDLGKKDDYYFIAMEYVQGKDLRVILKKLKDQGKWIPEELSIYLAINVLEGLSHAHSAKDNQGRSLEIVHRDISPPNILISTKGEIKITDFGVSKASIKIHQTISGALKGKLLYMSPEQAKGEKTIDYRSDLYSVGVLLFELITQEKLFLDTSEMEVLKKVQEGKVIAPSKIIKDIKPELEKIILKALTKDKNSRYQSASEMIRDLESYLKNNFTHHPTSIHVAHFLFYLFEKDFEKENVKVDLKSVPYEIKKKLPDEPKKKVVKTEPVIKEKPKAVDEEEELLLNEEIVVEEKPKKPEKTIPQKEKAEKDKEKFKPVIEIDFDKPRPIKKIGEPEAQAPETLPESGDLPDKKLIRPLFIEFDNHDQKKEKRRKKFLLFTIFLIFLVAVALGYYYFYYIPSTRQSEPLTKNPAASSEQIDKESPSESEPNAIQTQGSEMGTESPGITDETGQGQQSSAEVEKTEETGTGSPAFLSETGMPENLYAEDELDSKPVGISIPLPVVNEKIRKTFREDQHLLASLLIDQNGDVEKIRLLKKSSVTEINSLILSFLKEWKYRPGMKNGLKVKTWKEIPITINKYKE